MIRDTKPTGITFLKTPRVIKKHTNIEVPVEKTEQRPIIVADLDRTQVRLRVTSKQDALKLLGGTE